MWPGWPEWSFIGWWRWQSHDSRFSGARAGIEIDRSGVLEAVDTGDPSIITNAFMSFYVKDLGFDEEQARSYFPVPE